MVIRITIIFNICKNMGFALTPHVASAIFFKIKKLFCLSFERESSNMLKLNRLEEGSE